MTKLKSNVIGSSKKLEMLFRFLPYFFIQLSYRLLKKKDFNKITSTKHNKNLFYNGRYSLFGFEKKKCIFVHIPKTGGVSVAMSLFGNHGFGHSPIVQYRLFFNNKEYNSYFKFCFVRNPWDRLVSAYFFLKYGGFDDKDKKWFDENLAIYEDFDDFVRKWVRDENIYKWNHFIPQNEFITINSKIQVNKIYKIEEMNLNVVDLNKRFNSNIIISHSNKNSNRRKDYKSYYNSETRIIVEKVYKSDIVMFNYTFDS